MRLATWCKSRKLGNQIFRSWADGVHVQQHKAGWRWGSWNERMELNEAQERAVRAVVSGANLFLTGAGGTGKTFVIDRIREELKAMHGAAYAKSVVFAAPTGVAAASISGTTLNAALGIGCPRRQVDFASRMMRTPQQKRIRAWKTLIIDEISMVSAEFLELMDLAMRRVRNAPNLAFGGVQVVVVGDFYQLPPIVNNNHSSDTPAELFQNWGFAFQAPAWRKAAFEVVVLEEPMRQLQDPEFAALLSTLRTAATPEATAAAIRAICAAASAKRRSSSSSKDKIDTISSGIRPTTLYARNVDVDRINREELNVVNRRTNDGAPTTTFTAVDNVTGRSKAGSGDPFRNCLAPQTLELCVGAQVMLLKNLDIPKGLVNGSRGIVVAIDRATRVPWVRFIACGNATIPVPPVEFEIDEGDYTATRMQVPLKLAWAITVHKAQGMTLDCARVSLQSLFASGQAYVALSRVRSLDGLYIMDHLSDSSAVQANTDVHAFYMRLLCPNETQGGSKVEEEEDAPWTQWVRSKSKYGFRD
jgi:ATP-dependent DNA helicase PIF1